MLLFTKKSKHPDWYRVSNPAGLDLADVTNEASNPLIGLISIMLTPYEGLSGTKVCTAEITLIGATIHVAVLRKRGHRGCVQLAIPDGVELSIKIHAQVLRLVERLLKEAWA